MEGGREEGREAEREGEKERGREEEKERGREGGGEATVDRVREVKKAGGVIPLCN